jgi:predicted phosphoadenosine phosphosulfate sulfurtransferase
LFPRQEGTSVRKHLLGVNVFDAAVGRVRELYAQGHRVVVSFSGGKDSTALLGVAALAAKAEGRLPVEVAMRDDEAMLPGTFEYAGRVTRRSDVAFSWFWAVHPIPNVLDPECPFWWSFDPLCRPR